MFSILTSKIFGGVAAALLVALIFVYVSKTAVISHQDKTLRAQATAISNLKSDLRTARANADKLEFGLEQCNASAHSAAETATRIAQAGAAAVEQVRAAGVASTSAAVRRLEAMPRDGATAAQLCEQADAILLEGAN